MSTLPLSSDALTDASWEDIGPLYEELAQRPLDRDSVEDWLADWSRLTALIQEASALALYAYTCDTTDAAKEAAHLRFSSDIQPRAQEQEVRLAARLLDLGYRPDRLAAMTHRFANQREIFRSDNVPLLSEIEELQTRYQKVTGAMTVEWEGDRVPVPRMQLYLEEQDRDVRERAWRNMFRPYVEQRAELAQIFDDLYHLRQQVAKNAGFANYRDYAHREKNRFDYSPDDCLRWHESIEKVVVPAVARVRERRRTQLGLRALRPWDMGQDAEGRPPLRPFDGASELIAGCGRIFAALDPALAGYFQTMAREQLLDLESRKGKAPGGYCNDYPARKRPVIFMNAVGVHNDVQTLLHEAGHAFHCFEWADVEPVFQRFPGSEMCEVASMSMELLAAPHLERDRGGFYSAEEARRARVDHLHAVLSILPHIASVDAFQHWIYTDPDGGDRDARDMAWLRLRTRFDLGIDWTGLEAERIARWYFQIHFFCFPFYYIEYGLAQMAALQVWRNRLHDPAGALAQYRRALSLGGTLPLPELFAAAGARLLFDPEPMQQLVGLIEQQLEELSSQH